MLFGTAMTFIAQYEWGNSPSGAYTNDPNDSGGETKFGISKRAFPTVDIKNLDVAKAFKLYKMYYWDVCNCDHMISGMDMCVFDAAIQHGQNRALKWFKQCPGGDTRKYLELRREFYLSLNNKRYERGWLNRVNDLSKFIAINK